MSCGANRAVPSTAENEHAGAVNCGMGSDAGVDSPRAADWTRVSRWMLRGRGDGRRHAQDAAQRRWRLMCDGRLYGSAANRSVSGEQAKRSEVRCTPG